MAMTGYTSGILRKEVAVTLSTVAKCKIIGFFHRLLRHHLQSTKFDTGYRSGMIQSGEYPQADQISVTNMSMTFPDNNVQKRGSRRTRSAPVRGIQRVPDVWDKVSFCFKLSCMQVCQLENSSWFMHTNPRFSRTRRNW